MEANGKRLTTILASRSAGLPPKRRVSSDVKPYSTTLCFAHRPKNTYSGN